MKAPEYATETELAVEVYREFENVWHRHFGIAINEDTCNLMTSTRINFVFQFDDIKDPLDLLEELDYQYNNMLLEHFDEDSGPVEAMACWCLPANKEGPAQVRGTVVVHPCHAEEFFKITQTTGKAYGIVFGVPDHDAYSSAFAVWEGIASSIARAVVIEDGIDRRHYFSSLNCSGDILFNEADFNG